MNQFSPSSFFSLDSFSHKSIWQENDPVWAPLSRMGDYLRSLKLGLIEVKLEKSVHLERAELISIGKGTIIEPGVMIQGPCVIGRDCIIRHGAYLRGDLVVGDRCVIGHSAELKNSMFLDGCAATHFVYVGDSILGSFVNLGAGVKCANLRIDRNEVRVSWNETRIKTGLKKFGAIVGDRSQIGCNCVLNPGTLIGRESVLHPLLNVGGAIPAKSLVKRKNDWEVSPLQEKLLERLVRF